jgi:CubicO group peptidase (beta-lactamase class C family)
VLSALPRKGADLDQFTRHFLFDALGMTASSWCDGGADKNFAFTWNTSVLDMARLGLLMLHGGRWDGRRVLAADWIYRMTHPAFEDANTGWGYLVWLNASSNYTFGQLPTEPGWDGRQQVARSPGPCAPVSIYNAHPHGLSQATDYNYAAPHSCNQQHNAGVWQALGLFGQLIQGHPGLDLVIVVKDFFPAVSVADVFSTSVPQHVWDIVRPAVVAADPTFHGDDAAFCRAYGSNAYAPNL